jgi:hypothetical protein
LHVETPCGFAEKPVTSVETTAKFSTLFAGAVTVEPKNTETPADDAEKLGRKAENLWLNAETFD